MKTSPVQMLQLVFNKINVEHNVEHTPESAPNPLTSVFTFDGVPITTEVSTAGVDTTHEHGQLYLVAMHFNVGNEHREAKNSQVYLPYTIDINAKALVLILQGAEKLDTPENLATVNGASLIWSALRDQVLTLTSRMPGGPLMLPTVTFHDLRDSKGSTRKQTKTVNKGRRGSTTT
jgi:hypothetical protein